MSKRILILAVLLFISNYTFSQLKKVPFFDGFKNNKNNWTTSNNAKVDLNVSGGSYNFRFKNNTSGWEVHKQFDLDGSRDFKIEALIVKKSGVQGYGYGLMWGKSTAGDYYSFNITGSGYYRIAKMNNGKFEKLVGWKKSTAIKTGNGPYNILKIEKINNNINFYINAIKVETLNFSNFFGNQIGFMVYNDQAVEINYLSVYYIKKKNTVVTDYSNKFELPFWDGFTNNSHNWNLKQNNDSYYNIANGDLKLNHKLTSGWDEIHKSVNINTSKDFVISTSFNKVSGAQGYGYGVYWGSSDMNNRYTVLISGNGQYSVYKKSNGQVKYIKNWESSDAIKKGNGATNRINIKKINNTYQLKINDVLVKSFEFNSFFGSKIGFIVFNKQQINVNYLSAYHTKVKNIVNNNYQNDNIFVDNFNSNVNSWVVSDNENASLSIKNGYYNFKHKRDKYGWTTSREVKIDESKDFEIEADIKKIDGVQNNGYGIIWGRKNGDNQFQFFISADGSYYIRYLENSKVNIIKKWVKSSYINTGNDTHNKLKVKKEGNVFKYYINGNYVAKSDAKSFFGNRLGFLIYGRQSVAINSLNVSYKNKKIDTGNYLFYDEFTNNNNNWASGSSNDYSLSLSSGKYYFNHKRKTGGWSTSVEKYIDENKDYEIEAKILKISGIQNNGFGIMWGRKSSGNTLEFDIASSGLYSVDRSVNSKRNKLIKWTSSSYIKQGNFAYNTLKIRKQNDVIKFYINGNYVNQISNKTFLGNRIGFIVYDNQKIAIDYLKIKYLNTKNSPNIVTNVKRGLLNDDFNNNANLWAVGNTKDYYLGINAGKYSFEHKNTSGGWSSTLKSDLDQTRNFEISAEIKKVTGVSNYGYGLTWGRKDANNQYVFLISSDGNFKIKKMKQGNSTLLQDWKKTNYINKGNGVTNILSIRKNKNTLNFYINNNFVASKEFTPFYGTRMGFIIYANQKISINKLNVKYLKAVVDNSAPVIVITEPAVTRGFKIVKAKRITVRGKVTDADGVYEVTVNGVDAALQADGSFVAQVPLRVGDNDLNVKATDLKYNSSITKFKIKREVKPVVIVDPNIDNNNNIKRKEISTNGGIYYALLIGVSDYDDSKIVSLDGMPTNDIQNLGDALVGYYTFDKNNVESLSNPTRSQIIRAFDRLKKKITTKDNLLIFYAGHGTYVKEDNIGYWLPSDAEAEYTDNWINNTLVRDNIKRIKSRHTLLISDACFSGSIFKTRAFNIKNANLSIQKKYELPSRKAITSGTLKTVPNVSIFMKYLLDRLENNKDAYVSASQMFNRIEAPVGNNSPNTPQYGTIQGVGDEGGDFIFIRKN